MKKRILIAGASGMIGSGILNRALMSSEVEEVISLVRRKSGKQHDKLKEVVIEDFSNYDAHAGLFADTDAAYFCIGAYTGQLSDTKFKEITVDYTVAFADRLKTESPNARLCLLSGAGADRTEKSRTAFARYKGMAENRIAESGLEFYSFRPGYIYPVTPRKEPNFMYKLMRTLYPLFKLFGDNYSITSDSLANSMFLAGIKGGGKETLENKEIIELEARLS